MAGLVSRPGSVYPERSEGSLCAPATHVASNLLVHREIPRYRSG